MNSEIIGKPTDAPVGVLFARDIIDGFEYDNHVDNVEVIKRREENGDDKAKYPITIKVNFKKNNYQEKQLESYIQNNFKLILTNYEYVKMQVNEPADAPLNFQLDKNRDGTYTANIFTHGIPRHPTQLYESFTSFVLFVLLLWLWSLQKERLPYGRLLGLFLVILFGLRFFHEFFKVNQVDFEAYIPLNMGQWLSIPMVIAGLYILIQSYKIKNRPGLDKDR
jgi:prolipoprotein diacylglyceryltransferase